MYSTLLTLSFKSESLSCSQTNFQYSKAAQMSIPLSLVWRACSWASFYEQQTLLFSTCAPCLLGLCLPQIHPQLFELFSFLCFLQSPTHATVHRHFCHGMKVFTKQIYPCVKLRTNRRQIYNFSYYYI